MDRLQQASWVTLQNWFNNAIIFIEVFAAIEAFIINF